MKVLLVGEFSGLNKNLKDGLLELGHEVIIAASGDGFKKIPVDYSFDSTLPSLLGRLHRKFKPLIYLPKMQGFDIVQIVNPFIFNNNFFPREYFFDRLISENKKFFISGAGSDAYFWRYGRKKLKYGPFDDFLEYDLKAQSYFMESNPAFSFNKNLVEKSNGVIPIMYEYEVSYEENPKKLKTIPIPINTSKVTYKENKISNKIVVFHGLNRYGFKGTRHVEKAFEYLNKKYPKDLELIIDGKMPLEKYLKVMQSTNIVIDQMYSHSLGVNGVYALAMGKVVMGGAEPESLRSLGVNGSPVINLQPTSESIIIEIEKMLDNRNLIPQLGYEGRTFAEKVHGHVNIAKQYIDVWRIN